MSVVYQYQSSVEFIRNLEFDYIETYIFQRGQPEMPGSTAYLLNDAGAFHHTSQKINTFKKDSPEVEQLISILLTEVVEVPSWVCSPVYRDAVVFFDAENKMVAVLNICLECEHMAIAPFFEINADERAYSQLRNYLAEIGHANKQ